MNAKNIILAILMVLSFAACTSEIEGIDNNMTNTNVNNGTTSISVRMMTEGGSTKTISNNADMNINNYIIAVFESVSKQRISFVRGTSQSDVTVTSMTLKDIDSKEGYVDVVVIANLESNDEAQFDNIYNYDEFIGVKVGSLNKQVKVGVENNKELKSEGENLITVNLTQLSACVQVNVKEDASVNGDNSGKGKVSAKLKAVSYKANIVSESHLFELEAATAEMFESVAINNNFSYYTYTLAQPKLILNAQITISAEGKYTVIDREIEVLFKENGHVVPTLVNGKKYQLNIEANISVSVNCNVELSYELHEIEDIEQNIEFN